MVEDVSVGRDGEYAPWLTLYDTILTFKELVEELFLKLCEKRRKFLPYERNFVQFELRRNCRL